MSSYSFEVSRKFCTNPILTLKSKDNLNLKSQSFFPYEYTQKDLFSSMSWFLTTWNHLICFKSHQSEREKKHFWAKWWIMSERSYQQLHWARMNCFLTLSKALFIPPHWDIWLVESRKIFSTTIDCAEVLN